MALLRSALIACLVGLVLPACTQDEDEACQVDTDCADGLVCTIAGSQLRGTCLPPDQGPTEMEDDEDAGDETVDEDVSVPNAGGDDDAG
jgi:hypothetical protein